MSSSFSTRARAAIIVIAVVSLIATVATVLYGQRLDEPPTDGIDSFSETAIGHRALVEFYEAAGVHTFVDREGEQTRATAPVMFIEPQLRATVDHRSVSLEEVLQARRHTGVDTIVVLPKWTLDADGLAVRIPKDRAEEVLDAASGSWGGLELRREDIAIPATATLREWSVHGSEGDRRVVLQERQALRVVDRFEFEVMLGSESGALIVRAKHRFGEGELLIVSDPDLLHNYNLQRGDHGQIALDLLDTLGSDAVVIDEVFHQHAYHRTLGAALGRFPAVLIVVQALIVALLFALAGARSFGRRRAPEPARRGTEALVELAVRVLLDERRSLRISTAYVARSLAATASKLGLPEQQTLEGRAQAIDRAAAERNLEGGAVEIVEQLARTKPRASKAQLVLARRAHALRLRLSTRQTGASPTREQ